MNAFGLAIDIPANGSGLLKKGACRCVLVLIGLDELRDWAVRASPISPVFPAAQG
jgi:hypothetical protein